MPRTRITVTALKNQILAQQAEIDELRQAMPKPAAPTAPKPKPLPGWATQGDPNNTGANYSGPLPQQTGGESWAKKHPDGTFTIPGQPFGMRYYADGKPISPGPLSPRPIGPALNRQEQLDRQLIDRIVDREEDKEEEPT